MIKIKVCGMNDPVNVKDIAEIRPDFIGFIFYPASPRYVGSEPDRSLFFNVPSGIEKVGVFVNEDPGRTIRIADINGLGTIQLHGNESPEDCAQIRASGLAVIKAFSIEDNFDFERIGQYIPGCDYFLFDTKTQEYGGSGKKFKWECLAGYNLDKPFFLSGGIGPADAEKVKAIDNKGFYAADLNSRFEVTPGKKDVALLKTFIDEIKISL